MRSNLIILLAFLLIFAMIVPVSGKLTSHINPIDVNESSLNLGAEQLALINELLFYRGEILVSLNKGDFKAALENVGSYMRILRENDNILIKTNGDVYAELKGSGNTLNLTQDEINQLRALYEEGKVAYQHNQTDKAIEIALKARSIIRNFSALRQGLIMNSVEQYPGVNITLYRNGLIAFDNLSGEIQKRWLAVELILFDESALSISTSPPGGEFGDVININGMLENAKNSSGVPDANIIMKIDNETLTNIISDKKGRFNYTLPVPFKKPGNHSIQVDFIPFDQPLFPSSNESTFSIKPANTTLAIEINPEYGEFGDLLHVIGNLLAKNKAGISDADITISLDNEKLAAIKTDENGSYNYAFIIPVITSGNHTVNVEFIPAMQPLFQSGNKTTINVMETNTSIVLAAPGFAYRDEQLNINGRLVTLENRNVPSSDVAVLFDSRIIGTVPVKNGDFSFSTRIAKNVSLGNHTIVVRSNGESLFLPSENSSVIEIRNKPLLPWSLSPENPPSEYSILFLVIVAIGIVFGAFYLRKERVLMSRLDSLKLAIKGRISKEKKIEAPQIPPEPLVEMEKAEPPEPEVQEEAGMDRIYAHISDLIGQENFRESISLSFKNAQDYASTVYGIKNNPQQTHWEFYNLIKDTPAVTNEFKELAELYEAAMYSKSIMNAEKALKALNLLKKIHRKDNE